MKSNNIRIAFFGTPPFTTDFLDILGASGYGACLVVTGPDRPVGRGMVTSSPAPALWAHEHTVKVLQPEKLDDAFFDTLSQESWDLFVVVAYGKIMPQRLIDLTKYGTINVHYSLLPKYRGATPVESALLHGDATTGVSIQQMRYKLDSGPIIAVAEIPVAPDDTTKTLRDRLNSEAVQLLPPTLVSIFDGTLKPQEQSEEGASHCHKITKEDGNLDTVESDSEKWRKYRAYVDSIGVFFTTVRHGKTLRVKIAKAHYANGQFVIDQVIPENGKKMPYDIFLHSL